MRHRNLNVRKKTSEKASEIDDSRTTVIKRLEPEEETRTSFISVLPGKINPVYDLDAYLD